MGKPAILLSSVPWPRQSKIEKETVRILRLDRVEGRVLNVLAALLNDREVDNNANEIKRKSLVKFYYNYPISMILLFSNICWEKRRISNHKRMFLILTVKNLIKQLRLPNNDKLCMKPGSISLTESFSHFSWPSYGQLSKLSGKQSKCTI